MRILVTGSSGMLGKDIVEILSNNNCSVYGFSRTVNSRFNCDHQVTGDLTNLKFLSSSLDYINPDVIVHCAAIVNVDECETNKRVAEMLHCDVTKILSRYKSGSTRFIYISTDSVFDGQKGNYTEEEIANPINYYAKTKRDGEIIVLENNSNAVVIRTNIYGFHLERGKSLVEWAIDNFQQGKSMDGLTDMYFNPVYTKQLSEIIRDIIPLNYFKGILNVASKEYCSKYEFLLHIAQKFNFTTSLITKNSVKKFKFLTPRPVNTTLNTNLLKRVFDKVLTLQDGLSALNRDYENYERYKR
ncbi:MAG: SDR family oxidoreductase [Deltaproteobacteria bacterium]|jgi:dTDP-4-dehydrorhamnose reductase|nr:SDR family oxidoreductase [Deltaproteobacteria bacterium]